MRCIYCGKEAITIYEGNAVCEEHLATQIENGHKALQFQLDMMHRGLTRGGLFRRWVKT